MRRGVMLVLVAVLVLAACGGDNSGDADTPTNAATATVSAEFPEFPIPVVDGYTSVVANEELLLDLEYPASAADQIVAFYEEWTAAEGAWSPNEPNPDIGVLGAFGSDNDDWIDVLKESPDSPTQVILSTNGG